MGTELTGILTGTGAKMKAEVLDDQVSFRGAFKGEVPFEEIVAEARGTLLVLSFRGITVEVGAGARAAQLAAKVRSPPSRLDRMGIGAGLTAAVAGPVDPAFRSEVATRTNLVQGVPKEPVEVLFLAAEELAHLDALPRLKALVAPGGSIWVLFAAGGAVAAKVRGAAKSAGLPVKAEARFSATHVALRLGA